MVRGRGAAEGARARRCSLRGRPDRWGFFRGPKEGRCRRSRRGHTWRTAPSRRPTRPSRGPSSRRRSWSTSSSATCSGSWQHMTLPISAFGTSAFTEGLGFDGSSIRGWQGIAESDLLLMPDPGSAILDPFTAVADALAPLRDRRPDDRRGLRARPAPHRTPRRGLPDRDGDRGHGLLRPGVRVLRLRRGLLRALAAPRPLRGRLGRGPLELLGARARLHGAREGRLLPAGPARHPARPPLRDRADPGAPRDPVRVPPPRGRHGGPVRGRPPLPVAHAHGRPGHDLQVRRPQRRAGRRQERHLHAEADLRRQRLGDAHAPVALEGGHAALRGQVRLRGALPARAQLPGRHHHARAGAARLLRADDELVPAARARLRGAREPRVLAAEPLGRDPHPHVLGVGAGQAPRVPLPRPDGEPVPRLRGHADGGNRRRAEGPRSRASRPTSTSSRSGAATSPRSRARSPRRSTRSSATTSSSSTATSSARS